MDDNLLVTQARKNATAEWSSHFSRHYGEKGVEKLASGHRQGQPCTYSYRTNGSFNSCHKVTFDDGQAWAVRFPAPGRVMHLEAKVKREVAVMEFIRARTQIPIPKLIAWGTASDNHDPAMGPFIITEWIEGTRITDLVEELPRPPWGPVLREDLEDDIIRTVYRQMAAMYLELSVYEFDKIGSLSLHTWSVDTRPLTLKMNETEADGNVVLDDHELAPYHSTSIYMQNLVSECITHLYKQPNSVDDAADARRKFILRHRMREIVKHFVIERYNSGPFKLFCDDFSFGNVLVDEKTFKIIAVIDWEWTYAAPHQFLFSPPPWLIIERPTSWTTNEEAKYRKHLDIFLQCLAEEEDKRENLMPWKAQEQRMSTLMRQYFEDGTFWVVQLLRQSFNFDDETCWQNIERILDARGLAEVGILSEDDIATFVDMKMRELKAYNDALPPAIAEDNME